MDYGPDIEEKIGRYNVKILLYLLSFKCEQKRQNQEDLTMRESRAVQSSIFDFYSQNEHSQMLCALSDLLDKHVAILPELEQDLSGTTVPLTGRCGLSVESVFRCMVLKMILQISYRKLAFYLSDSPSYRCFARLSASQFPGRSSLQSGIRKIRPETLQKIHQLLCSQWHEDGFIDDTKVRIDSTVVEADIAPPSDSQLLEDCVRVLTRQLVICKRQTGHNVRFTDQRSKARKIRFAIFYAKESEKQALYPQLLTCAYVVLKQIDRALIALEAIGYPSGSAQWNWCERARHFRLLLCKVIHQTQQRVYENISVPANEKIFSVFEPHTDIIVKGARDVQYGHKINLATDTHGLVLYLSVLEGNPADKVLYKPVLERHEKLFGQLPHTTVADGGYASLSNVTDARAKGVTRAAFHKRAGLGYHLMGVKKKTLASLRAFRAGIEGNISELKRAFGLFKARWKNKDGFDAFVWAGVISYNLVRMARLSSA